jgi:DNA polymerase III subunit gamma/tau
MQLNLTRAWRSKTFEEILGQELVVRVVKNSLYRDKLFPVYLLSGQRGCGKTTMARVFAGAINCTRLSHFQQHPQEVTLPCLSCQSCVAMRLGNHPDFIEIDAASHTGVDNVRTIIEAASYLPVMGHKKIYLIDEAHMLSKAAFNAFLKILEEPPKTALFMLATTDIHKVIDTVRSRCFHLFFQPVPPALLVPYLEKVCKQENITFDSKALYMITEEAEGSVRDALNSIERIRLSHDAVTQEAVSVHMGGVSNERLLHMFNAICSGDSRSALQEVQSWQQSGYQLRWLWKQLIQLIRGSVFLIDNIKVDHPEYSLSYRLHDGMLAQCVKGLSLDQLLRMWQICNEAEQLIIKTMIPQSVLEFLIVTLCRVCSTKATVVPSEQKVMPGNVPLADVPSLSSTEQHAKEPRWESFLQELEALRDPLVTSLFKQGKLIAWDEQGKIEVVFPAKFAFFNDMLASTEFVWKKSMQKIAGCPVTFISSFSEMVEEKKIDQNQPLRALPYREKPSVTLSSPLKKQGVKVLDVQDKEHYPQAHALLKLFPGTVYEKEDTSL